MHLVQATPADAATLTAIAFAAKAHWGYPANWLVIWRPALTITPEIIASQPVVMANEGELSVGFYALRADQSQVWLDHLWVLPQAMERHVGRRLFEHAARQAASLGFVTLVIESDPHAAGFYLRMGAKETGAVTSEIGGVIRELPRFQYNLQP